MSNQNNEVIFADGIRFDRPSPKAPEFIRGKLSFDVDRVIVFLKKYKNDKGWVNLDLKKSKGGNLYLTLNDYQKSSIEPNEIPPEESFGYSSMDQVF